MNHFHYSGVASHSIEHNVIEMMVRPVKAEIFLDERRAFPIDCLNLLNGLTVGLAGRNQPANPFFSRGVEKDAKYIFSIFQKILRSSADNHARPIGSCFHDNTLRHFYDPVCIQKLQLAKRWQAPFECASHERFEHAVDARIHFPFPSLDGFRYTLCQSRDFESQQFVPQLPPHQGGKLTCDLRATASALALDCDNSNHPSYLASLANR